MKYKVVRKHNNSRMCFVCGLSNQYGLKTAFYELENGDIVSLCTPEEEHQGYPGRLHGGLITALLDETIGRAVNIKEDNVWGVTADINVKFKKAVPLGVLLRITGRITRDSSRLFEGTGELILPDGEVAATASGRYMKLPIDKITSFDFAREQWYVHVDDNDPKEIDI